MLQEVPIQNTLDINSLEKHVTHVSHGVQDELIAGTLAGWAQVVVGHPFDTVKVKLQTQTSPHAYNGPIDCVKKLIKADGPSGLFRGVTSPLLGVGVCNSIIFSSNGFFKRQIARANKKSPDNLSLGEITLAGGLTGTAVAFISCPVELIKVQLQLQRENMGSKSPKIGLIKMAQNVVSSHGPLGLYRGFLTTLSRDIPSFAGYFATYNGLRSLYIGNRNDSNSNKLPALYQLLFGGMAGVACWAVCYPQDVIKSRIQGSSLSNAAPTLSQTWKLLLSEGSSNTIASRISPFLRGITPTLARAFPANAATFLVYEAYINGFSF